MSQLLEAFVLGNAAILGNVCLLPLYPGLFALLATRAETSERSVRFLGLFVLAGVLTALAVVAAILTGLNAVIADVLPVVLPLAYGAVIVLGVLMLLDRNPLARLGTGQVPVLSSNTGSAFVYGLALGPMTLPCTGPVILTAFVLGGVAGTGAFVDQALYFLFFGLGFGWPLVALPLLAGARQRAVTSWLTRNHRAVTVASGALLIAIAAYGLWVEFA